MVQLTHFHSIEPNIEIYANKLKPNQNERKKI